MSTKLYVGNLSFEATEADLRDLFTPFGPLEDLFIGTDKFTGKSRGFAFVTLASSEAAEEAMKSLDGSEFGGRMLKVNEAREKTDRPPFRGGDRQKFRSGKGGYRPKY